MLTWRRLIFFLVPCCLLVALFGCDGEDGSDQPKDKMDPQVQVEIDPESGTFHIGWDDLPAILIQDATSRYCDDSGWVSAMDYPSGCVLSTTRTAPREETLVLTCLGDNLRADLELQIKLRHLEPSLQLQVKLENRTERTITIHGLEPLSCTAQGGCALRVGSDPEAASVLINGQASWAYSGVVNVRRGSLYKGDSSKELSDEELLRLAGGANELARIVEILLNGWDKLQAGVSWWNIVLHAPGLKGSLVAGALTAERWKTAHLVEFDPEDVGQPSSVQAGEEAFTEFRVVCGITGDRVPLSPGEEISSEKVWLTATSDTRQGLSQYAREVASQNPSSAMKRQDRTPLLGWSSWSAYFSDVDEDKVLEHAQFVKEHLSPHGYRVIQLDDGYQLGWGDWRPNSKFPSGLHGLCEAISAMDLIPGVWIAPFLVQEDLPVVQEHPDWFLRDHTGMPIRYVAMLGDIPKRPLDMTHPGAREFVSENLTRLREAGFRLFKVDFLFGASYEGLHFQPEETGISTLRSALRLVREAVGEDAWLLLVEAPWLASVEVADYFRQSFDVAFSFMDPAWPFFEAEARSTIARFYSHNTLFRSDPDHILLHPSISQEEAKAVVTYGALIGGMWLLGDVLPTLPDERLDLATHPEILRLVQAQEGAVPLDLFSHADPFPYMHPIATMLAESLGLPRWTDAQVPRVWALTEEDGVKTVGVFNWEEEQDDRTWRLEELGIDQDQMDYGVQDLWEGQRWSLPAGEDLFLSIPPHGVALLRITPE